MFQKLSCVYGVLTLVAVFSNIDAIAQTTATVDDTAKADKAMDKGIQETECTLLAVLSPNHDDTEKVLAARIVETLGLAGLPDIKGEEAIQLLNNDKNVIRSASADVVKYYQSIGFKNQEVAEAVSSAWCSLRSSPDTNYRNFNKEEFLFFVHSFCYTVVESDPSDAQLHIEQADAGRTTSRRYLSRGKHQFRLDKNGYQPFIVEESVVPDQKNAFKYTLVPLNPMPKGSPATKKTP